MATFFLDYLLGNDANDGTTFANRWKTLTTGATAARIAPGDAIRLKKSPDPTSLGNAKWTNGPLNPSVAITSSTNATPIVVTRASHGLTTDDTVIVNAHTTNTKANGVWKVNVLTANTFELKNEDGTNSVGNGVGGATGTFRPINNLVVRLASALTANIAVFGNQGVKTNWTASANVTDTIITTDFKEGGECQQIAIGAAFTTGLAAFFATGTLDLSTYQQLSFRIKQTAGTVGAAGSVQLKLCSDVAGVTAVDTFDIPNIAALNNWMAFTVDKGSALGASIKSIALYVVTDNGAQTFLLDNIIASKASSSADSLSLTSLIGKNTAGETFWPIQSINGTRVVLDGSSASRPTTNASGILQRGYMGTTETVTTYKRETIKIAPNTVANLAVNSVEFALQDSGTDGVPITITGGWDTTNMTTQDGETWIDGQNGFGSGFSGASRAWFSFDKLSAVRYNSAFLATACHDFSILGSHLNANTTRSFYSNQNARIVLDIKAMVANGIDAFNSLADSVSGTIGVVDANAGTGGFTALAIVGKNWDVTVGYVRNNIGYGVQFEASADNVIIRGVTTSGNGTSGVASAAGNQVLNGSGRCTLIGATINEATEVTTPTWSDTILWSVDHDGAAGAHLGFIGGALIQRQQTFRHVASGWAYVIQMNSAVRTVNFPVPLELMQLAVAANTLVTVKWWMYRSAATITQSLVCKGGQIAGVAADVRSSVTVNATWEEITITFTPTEAGVVSITSETYGASPQFGAVDDASLISQA